MNNCEFCKEYRYFGNGSTYANPIIPVEFRLDDKPLRYFL